jgi:AcrR family transcriptional regulator
MIKKKIKKHIKKPYHHEGLRDAILKKALIFLRSHSVQSLSMRDIARSLGVSHMAPYRHFASKEEILATLMESGFRQLTAKFRECDQIVPMPFPEFFCIYIKVYAQFFWGHPELARLMFNGGILGEGDFPGLHAAGQEAFSCLMQLVERGQQEGFITKSRNVYMTAFMIWSSVHGASILIFEKQFQEIDQAPDVEPLAFVRFLAEGLLGGVAK